MVKLVLYFFKKEVIMKKLLLTLILIFTLTLPANAYYTTDYLVPYTLSVNGNVIETEDNSYIIDNTAYAPIRFVLNAIGIYEMEWDDSERSVTFSHNDTTVKLYEGYDYAFINDTQVKLDNLVLINNDRTLVPVRFVSELFGFYVDWNNTFYIVNLVKDELNVDEGIIEKDYNLDDVMWLSRIIEAESSGEPFSGKIAVGNVILNRVKCDEFPDTISEVIFDRKFGVQFQPVANNKIYNTPSNESVMAALLAIRDVNLAGDSLYFLNPVIATNRWILNNRTYYITINNHDFYL
ncbi:MAG: copper amine oxidase [Ruminococcaceae bacterium]|nr:copper amine oxidase [Oscillospiraceae bacterium]